MSYDQRIRGQVTFSTRSRLEAGLDGFLRQLAKQHTTAFGLADLGMFWEEQAIYAHGDPTASASHFEDVLRALRRLAEYADDGWFELTFDGATEIVSSGDLEPPSTPLEHQATIDAFLREREARHLQAGAEPGD